MRYGLLFLVLGLSLVGLGAAAGGAAWLSAWPALSFAWVGMAYLRRDPARLGKQPDGTIAVWSWILLGPYLIFTAAVWHAERLFRREDAANEVAPGLWVGRRPLGGEIPAGVRVILDLTAELTADREVRSHAGYRCSPVLDGAAPETAALRALVAELAGEDGVLVHCASGHGRSATVAAALLIARGIAPDVEGAERALRARRPGIRLRAAQREAAGAAR